MNTILKVILTLISIVLLLVTASTFNNPHETVINETIINESITIINESLNVTIVNDTIINETPVIVNYDYLLKQKGELLDYYPPNSCEKIAKDYQKEYGGRLVFAAPYNTKSGLWIRGDYAGHWINVVTINDTNIYIDYGAGYTYINKEETITYTGYMMQNKFQTSNVSVKLFIYGEDTMPYPIIWHY